MENKSTAKGCLGYFFNKPKGVGDKPGSAPPKLAHTFHVNLPDKMVSEDYWLHVAGKKYPLAEHTATTRATARQLQPALIAVPDEHLTHFNQAPAHIPLGTVTRISVRHTNKTGNVPGDFGVHFAAIHIVPNDDEHQMMAARGLVKVAAQPVDYVSTAKAFLFHHADLMTKDAAVSGQIMNHMDQNMAPATFALIEQLATEMRAAGVPTATTGWANYQDFDAGTAGTKQTLLPTAQTVKNAAPAMSAVLNSTKNDPALNNKCWAQETGTSVKTTAPPNSPLPLNNLIASVALDETGDNWTPALSNAGSVHGLETIISVVDSAARQVSITMNNYYVRWLAAYIQFIDADGIPLKTPEWMPDGDGIIAEIVNAAELNYDEMRFIGFLSPVDTIFAAPITEDPGTFTVNITFPENAVSANLYGCGIGTGSNQFPKTVVIGAVLTGLTNLTIPALFLGFTVAAQTYKPAYKIVSNPTFIKSAILAGGVFLGTEFAVTAAVDKKMNWSALSMLGQILFTQGLNKLLIWVSAETTADEIVDEIPFAGWAMAAINIVTGLAQLAETIVAITTSPWAIPNAISTTITSTVTVHPDPRHGAFPQPPAGSKVTYLTKMIYKQQNRPVITSPSVTLDPALFPSTLSASFINTLGGQVKFEVDFYIDNWLAGKATTSWLENNEANTAAVTLFLVQNPIPLTSTSVYKHSSILGFQNNAYAWLPDPNPPTATIAIKDTSQNGNAISDWTGLALSQRDGMLGFSWKAAGMGITDCSNGANGQLYAFQNVNIPGTPLNALKFPGCGFSAPSEVVYDVFPPRFLMVDGNFVIGPNGNPTPDPNDISLGNYYIDPRKAGNDEAIDGGYFLRQITLDTTTPINTSPNQNAFGRFPYYPDSITMHPSGHVIGVNRLFAKMMITPLAPDSGLADNNIPFALSFAGKALNFNGSGGRAGLLFTPVAITCSYDGTILVLEQLTSEGFSIARIQAFDLNGNPVNCFQDTSGNPSPLLLLPPDITYLDVAAVGDNFSTFLYVLSFANSGSDASDYKMSIYQYGKDAPVGNLLVTTPNIPAARLNADYWHTLYTLNFAMTQDGQGHNAGPTGPNTGPAGRTVPSISEWLPIPVS